MVRIREVQDREQIGRGRSGRRTVQGPGTQRRGTNGSAGYDKDTGRNREGGKTRNGPKRLDRIESLQAGGVGWGNMPVKKTKTHMKQ